jgi:hypothetical protein
LSSLFSFPHASFFAPHYPETHPGVVVVGVVAPPHGVEGIEEGGPPTASGHGLLGIAFAVGGGAFFRERGVQPIVAVFFAGFS